MTQKKLFMILIMALFGTGFLFGGCGKENSSASPAVNGSTADVTEASPDDMKTQAPTEETVYVPTEPATEKPTEAPTEAPTEEPTEPYVGAWTLLIQEPLNPTQSGYEELDTLVNNLLASLITEDMNNYQKVWTVYEYFIDNITYSRGMDAHTGEYSSSDKSVTPTEVLWATDLLNSGQGCCYNYSAAFMYIMRAIGYDAHLVSGNVPKYGGGVTPHCWLYVNLGGKQYTFDPDLDMNFYTRDLNNGVENPAKDRYFCVPVEDLSYFYVAETYHTN